MLYTLFSAKLMDTLKKNKYLTRVPTNESKKIEIMKNWGVKSEILKNSKK